MRVIAELPHPECKITIFGMNGKYIIKCEKGTFEQTYKISEADITGGINGLFQLLDEEFLGLVSKRFDGMRDDFRAAYMRFDS